MYMHNGATAGQLKLVFRQRECVCTKRDQHARILRDSSALRAARAYVASGFYYV
jgi:hypothetical protein